MKARGDVLSDKVYLGDQDVNVGEGEGLRISQSESILTDMTHVISPMSFSGKSPMLQQYQAVSKWTVVNILQSFINKDSPHNHLFQVLQAVGVL